jgi:hypothetical protein
MWHSAGRDEGQGEVVNEIWTARLFEPWLFSTTSTEKTALANSSLDGSRSSTAAACGCWKVMRTHQGGKRQPNAVVLHP